jgi:threonyl-tRNA synthetase
MRILQLHSDFIEYQPTRKEIASAEETNTELVRLEDIVVLLTCIERGDSDATVRSAVKEIIESLNKIGSRRILIYPYAHLSTNLAPPREALSIMKMMESLARGADLEVYRAPFGWTKAFSIKVKGHPLAEQSKVIIESEDEKMEKELGATSQAL